MGKMQPLVNYPRVHLIKYDPRVFKFDYQVLYYPLLFLFNYNMALLIVIFINCHL